MDPFCDDVQSACQAVLAFLRRRFPFAVWMVTQIERSQVLVVAVDGGRYDLAPGQVWPLADTCCAHTVQDQGPRWTSRVDQLPGDSAAPSAAAPPIAAYSGVPLVFADGQLFGSLCAWDPRPQPDPTAADVELLELLARLLGSVLDSRRRADEAQAESLTDPLTGLYNRRGWERILESEEARCRRHGHSACVLVADLDDLKTVNDRQGHAAGDALLRAAAAAIRRSIRAEDVAARVGGDEFCVLASEFTAEHTADFSARLAQALAAAGAPAALGAACRGARASLADAWTAADQALCAAKQARSRRPLASLPTPHPPVAHRRGSPRPTAPPP